MIELERELPARTEAERTILGAILLDNEAWGQASGITAKDFSLAAHRILFERMGEMILRGQPVDLITLPDELTRRNELGVVGGVAWLCSLTEGLPRRLNIEQYAAIVREKALARRLIEVCSEFISRAADQSEPAGAVVVSACMAMESLMQSAVDPSDTTAEFLVPEMVSRFDQEAKLERSPGLSTGIAGLDRLTGGIQAGHQWAVGARSGVGKTSAMSQMIYAACGEGQSVSAYLLEPTQDDILRKLASMVAGVRYTAVVKPWTASREEREAVKRAAQIVAGWNLRLFDKPGMTLEDVLAWMRKYPARLNCVDYIQRLKVRQVEKGEDVRMRISRASTALADAVKGTGSSNVVLSQLSRKQEVWDVPTMQDFRESSQIENDAHVIVLLHRRYDRDNAHYMEDGAVIVPKVRFGEPGNLQARLDPKMAVWEA